MARQVLAGGLIVLIATSLIAEEPARQNALQRDTTRIQGTWRCLDLEANGAKAPQLVVAALKLVFKDDTLSFKPGEPGFTNYSFRIDPTTKPAHFDITHAAGSKKGKTTKGIYSLNGDQLTICFSEGNDRPKELTAKPESGQVIFSLKRAQP